jgi:hypothetical protein
MHFGAAVRNFSPLDGATVDDSVLSLLIECQEKGASAGERDQSDRPTQKM